MEIEQEFNQLFYRPPNFCIDCGDLLDFEIINNNSVKCQKCGGETELDNIKNHYIETNDKYELSGICFCLFDVLIAVINCLFIHIFAKDLKVLFLV